MTDITTAAQRLSTKQIDNWNEQLNCIRITAQYVCIL